MHASLFFAFVHMSLLTVVCTCTYMYTEFAFDFVVWCHVCFESATWSPQLVTGLDLCLVHSHVFIPVVVHLSLSICVFEALYHDAVFISSCASSVATVSHLYS